MALSFFLSLSSTSFHWQETKKRTSTSSRGLPCRQGCGSFCVCFLFGSEKKKNRWEKHRFFFFRRNGDRQTRAPSIICFFSLSESLSLSSSLVTHAPLVRWPRQKRDSDAATNTEEQEEECPSPKAHFFLVLFFLSSFPSAKRRGKEKGEKMNKKRHTQRIFFFFY